MSRHGGSPIALALVVALSAACGGESTKATSNLFVQQNPSGGVDKIDVLFMIDNSLSMGDKQEVVAAAIPQLLGRLTNPDCVDPNGVEASVRLADPHLGCPVGLQREFAPVKDIHIGVVTSSLGDYGGDTCPELPNNFHPNVDATQVQNAAQNDHAWLMGALARTGLPNSPPFVQWTAEDAAAYTSAITAKQNEFGNQVRAATELGCDNEMSLEAWYRFLVDPNPPQDVTSVNQAANQRGPVDTNILQQRQAFLRPDSLLAVFMLADENDCSMKDTGSYAWVAMSAGSGFRMWRGSSPCASNPNDPCCYSCMLASTDLSVSQACLEKDTSCRQGDAGAKLTLTADDMNMRCRQMKRRFGYDFLFPPKRYVNALTKLQICPDSTYPDLDCDCVEAKSKGIACNPGNPIRNPVYVNLNPTYVPTGPERVGPDSVFLAGVVGVPWQDLARDPSASVLEYKRATELDWSLFAPRVEEDYSVAVLGDPLMIESASPRTGTHPITGQALAGPDAVQMANSINGHEWHTSNKDVQFACIFSLDVQLGIGGANATRICDLQTECGAPSETDEYKVCARRFDGCSCTLTAATATTPNPLDPTVSHSPLCQAVDNSYGNKQFFAKAYPGLRQLQVLRGFYEATASDNAIAGSICPKDLDPTNKASAGYGYNPTVKALVDRLKEKLGGACLPRSLAVEADGTIACTIVEAISPQTKVADPQWCNCTANGRSAVAVEVGFAVRDALRRDAICGTPSLPSCSDFCLCGLNQLSAGTPEGDRCLNELNVEKTSPLPGFCYVDPEQGQGSADVVAACPGSQKRVIRIIGAADKYYSAPAPGRVFIACSGAASGG